jgi:hypothetical protein
MSDFFIGFHALTGCDTTSAFKGHGKKRAFQLLARTWMKTSGRGCNKLELNLRSAMTSLRHVKLLSVNCTDRRIARV